MTRITLLAGVSLLFIAVPANAAPAPPPSQAPQQAPTATAPGNAADSEIICQKQEVTGSRLAKRKICLTRGEWMRAQMDDKAWTERIQHRGDASSQ